MRKKVVKTRLGRVESEEPQPEPAQNDDGVKTRLGRVERYTVHWAWRIDFRIVKTRLGRVESESPEFSPLPVYDKSQLKPD